MKAEPRRIGGINLFFSFPENLKNIEQRTINILKQTGITCPVAQSIHPDIEVNIDWGAWAE
jgi:hypothetical protein